MLTRSRPLALLALLSVAAFAPRASAQGSLLWSRWYELPEASDGNCFSTAIAVKPNGDTISAVWTPFLPARRFLAYGPAGFLKWSTKAGPQSNVSYRRAVADAAGNSYFVGSTSSSIIVVSLGPTGTLRWETSFLVAHSSTDYDAVFDESGQRLVVALSEVPAVRSHVLSFAASNGTTTDQTIDFATSGTESVQAIAVDDAGFVHVCGFASPTGFAARISPSGQVVWTHVVPAAFALGARYEQIAISDDGNLALLGEWQSPTNGMDLLATLLDPAGNIVWSAGQDGGSSVVDVPDDIAFASDGSIWSCGTTSLAAGLRPFITRHERADGAAQSFPTSIRLPSAQQPPRVFPGHAGQMWLVAGDQPVGSSTQGVTANVFGLDAAGTIGSFTRLAVWHPHFDYILADSGMNEQQSLSLVGRTSDTPGAVFFDEPAWTARFDTRSVPDGYCTAQVNSLGCTPNLTYSGSPSVSETSGFDVRVDSLLDHRYGLFFYGATSAVSVPFQGGTKCVASPVRRSPILDTGSLTSTFGDCSGRLSLDWNAFASGALGGSPAPELSVVGTTIYLQAWTRDPQAPFGTNLSSALRYVVLN